MSENKYDDKGYVIYRVFPYHDNLKEWYKYDKNHNMIYAKASNGKEIWWEYDEKNRIIYTKKNEGRGESWYKYNEDGEQTDITKRIIKEIEFLKREPISRFELMEL